MSFIQILDDSQPTFPWKYTDPDTNDTAETVFYLRQMPEDMEKQIRARHTKDRWKRGVRTEDFDTRAYGIDCLNYCIVSWEKLFVIKTDRTGNVVSRKEAERDLALIKALPEKLKAEIIRVCVGKEVGGEFSDEDTDQAPQGALASAKSPTD